MAALSRRSFYFEVAALTGPEMTIKKVARGPKNREATHQSNPLRPFDWASPALIKESVPHPTKKSAFSGIVSSPKVSALWMLFAHQNEFLAAGECDH